MRKRGICLAVIDTLWVTGYLTALGNKINDLKIIRSIYYIRKIVFLRSSTITRYVLLNVLFQLKKQPNYI